jgi:hypothetical protein
MTSPEISPCSASQSGAGRVTNLPARLQPSSAVPTYLQPDDWHRTLPLAQAKRARLHGHHSLGSRLPSSGFSKAAFGVDERTVARWEREAGMQSQRVHEHIVEAGRVELGQVLRPTSCVCGWSVGGVMWLAGALALESRLWLGGVVSLNRDRTLIRTLLSRVRACGLVRMVLLYAPTDWPELPQSGDPPLQKSLFAPARWAVRGSSCRRG